MTAVTCSSIPSVLPAQPPSAESREPAADGPIPDMPLAGAAAPAVTPPPTPTVDPDPQPIAPTAPADSPAPTELPAKVGRRNRRRRATAPPLLESLGVFGMAEIEPVILAALATESPMLLIGPPGTAKSLLLLRLSEALGLSFRHYNASLLNYDDLVGYPMPDASGGLRFVQTPASIWEAEVVFLDEIARCRPDLQNRLFPIVHEKVVQGIPLTRLVHRWAAMNPPPLMDENENVRDYDDGCTGIEPLDAALADRFSFVVPVQPFDALSARDKIAVITQRPGPIEPADAERLRQLVQKVGRGVRVVERAMGPAIGEFVRLLAAQLLQMRLRLSGRRVAMLYRNVLAVHAARVTFAADADPADSAWLAVRHSLPQPASGRDVPMGRLSVACREAWDAAARETCDPRRLLAAESDPARRAVLAVSIPSLGAAEFSAYVADALADARLGAREALAVHILDTQSAASRLTAAVAEDVAAVAARAIAAQDVSQEAAAGSPLLRAWKRLVKWMSQFRLTDPDGEMIGNVLRAGYVARELTDEDDVDDAIGRWRAMRAMVADGQAIQSVPGSAAPAKNTAAESGAA